MIELEDHSQRFRPWHATKIYGESWSADLLRSDSKITSGHMTDDDDDHNHDHDHDDDSDIGNDSC